jgi:hypothetical protein
MTTAQTLALLRRRIADLDASAAYADGDLLDALDDARRALAVKQVAGISGYTVVSDAADAAYGIAPDPTDEHATLLVLRACADLLREKFRAMLGRGEFGTSWTSGPESESSIDASRHYKAAVDAVERELGDVILVAARLTSSTRPQ